AGRARRAHRLCWRTAPQAGLAAARVGRVALAHAHPDTRMTPLLLLEFVALAALWGASFLFMRLGAAEFGPVPTAGLRVGIAALCLLPVFLRAPVWAGFRARWRPILIVGLLNSGLPFLLFSFAVLHIPTGVSAILNATVPLT